MTELEMDYGTALRNYRLAMEAWIGDPTDDNYEMVGMWGDILQDLGSEMGLQPRGWDKV